MKIMTGKTGTPHVTSQQFRQLVESTVGQGSYILTSGENLEPELQTSNSLKIRSGMMSHHGNLSVVELGTYDEVTIQNGTQGMQRIDLVVNRYTRNEETGIEDNEWFVIMGTPAASDPVAPAYTEGNLQVGDLVDDCPVFEVHLDGINVTEVVKLLDVTSDMSTLNASLSHIKFEIIESERYYVKKYENGWFEAWAKTAVNSGDFSFIAFGGTSVLYRAKFTNFGFGIKATEVYDIEVSAANNGIIWCASCRMNSNMSAIDGFVVQHGSDNARTTTLRAHVTGKWK
jgi:hypothetical protein